MYKIILCVLLFLFTALAVTAVTDRAGPAQASVIENAICNTTDANQYIFCSFEDTGYFDYAESPWVILVQAPLPAINGQISDNQTHYTIKESTTVRDMLITEKNIDGHEVALRDAKSPGAQVIAKYKIKNARSDPDYNAAGAIILEPAIVIRT